MQKQWDTIWINATIATCDNGYGLIRNAAIAVKDGKIAWIGPQQELAAKPDELAQQVYDANNGCITPGFIDCHTHVVFAGNRAHEFEERLNGVSYEEIAK